MNRQEDPIETIFKAIKILDKTGVPSFSRAYRLTKQQYLALGGTEEGWRLLVQEAQSPG